MINKLKEKIWQLHFKKFGSCVYLIKIPKPILIDTSSKEVETELLKNLKELHIDPQNIEKIILTHNHWDHAENLALFPHAKIYSTHNLIELKKDFPQFKIFETPGHTRDSICILYEEILFSGDTIFDKDFNYIGRTDLPESLPEKMQNSIELIKKIPYKILAPGHLV